MSADSTGPDPKTLWRHQDQEADPVSLERVHAMIRRYEARMRISIGVFAASLVIIGLLGGELWAKAHDLFGRALAIVFVAGELCVCALSYRIAFPTRDPVEPAGAYLRRRLRIRLRQAQGGWLLIASPLAPFILLALYPALTSNRGPLWARLLPFAVFVVILAFVAWRMRIRATQIQAKIDELDELLKH
jgi:hypothetical protein